MGAGQFDERSESKRLEQTTETALCLLQVPVMSEPREGRRIDSGLLGIEFPRMKVEDAGVTLSVELVKRMGGETVGE